MKPIIISIYSEGLVPKLLADDLNCDHGFIDSRIFPDGESYIKFNDDLEGRDVIILCSLDHPNPKILPLLFVAKTAKSLGASKVGLCSPYLAYMRQDKVFHRGEGVTAAYFADLISDYFDWVVTVDPHLHRIHNLSDIYSIPSKVLHAAKPVSDWVTKNVENPVLIGPDIESEQWVKEVAKLCSSPFTVLHKVRYGDRDVKVSLPNAESLSGKTPVLIDDIISTAKTMIETVSHLKNFGLEKAVCIGVHPIFSGDSYNALKSSWVRQIVSCNTIRHETNAIDIRKLIVSAIGQLI